MESDIDKLKKAADSDRDTIRKFSRRTLILLSILVIGMLGLATYDINLTTTNDILTKGTYGSCHRLNIVRAVDNENFYNNYNIIVRSSDDIKLIKNVEKDRWVPLTNCNEAVNHPFTYVPPGPIEFSKQVPSRFAFHLGPDN